MSPIDKNEQRRYTEVKKKKETNKHLGKILNLLIDLNQRKLGKLVSKKMDTV